MADDLEALRVHLGISEINLLGHSNSGAIALSYAARFPDHLSKLVLIGSQVLGFSAAAETQRILQSRSTEPRFEEATKAMFAFFGGQVNPGVSDEILGDFVAQILPLYLYRPEKSLALAREQLSGPISSYAFVSQFTADAASKTDLTQSLGDITAKTIVLVGRHDFICPVMLSERLHKEIHASRLVIFEESGHFPWLEEPKAFFEELEGFLLS